MLEEVGLGAGERAEFRGGERELRPFKEAARALVWGVGGVFGLREGREVGGGSLEYLCFAAGL